MAVLKVRAPLTRLSLRECRQRLALSQSDDQAVWPKERPLPLTWDTIPADYAAQIKRVRLRFGLTQGALAPRIGAAGDGRFP